MYVDFHNKQVRCYGNLGHLRKSPKNTLEETSDVHWPLLPARDRWSDPPKSPSMASHLYPLLCPLLLLEVLQPHWMGRVELLSVIYRLDSLKTPSMEGARRPHTASIPSALWQAAHLVSILIGILGLAHGL